MKDDDYTFIGHIDDAGSLILKYIENIDYHEFLNDNMIQDAVIRRLSIIGEATKNISKDFKEKHTNIPWKDMAGMRDIVIHKYILVDLEEVWNTLTKDIPLLKKNIEDIIKAE